MAGSSIKDMLSAAESAERAGDTGHAAAIYRDILTRMPKHSRAKKALARLEGQGGGRPRMTQNEASQLVGLLNSGNFAAVVDAADQLNRHFREEAFVWNVRALAEAQLGRQADAVKSYRWAIKLDPNFVEAMGNLGALLVQMGRADEAVDVLRKAVARRPDYAEAHHNLGVALLARGEEDAALAQYDRAIALNPSYANALSSRGTLHKARANIAAAIEDFEAAALLMPRDVQLLSKLAGALADAGRIDPALESNARALKLARDDIDLLAQRALILNEAGRRDAARAAFEQVLSRAPDTAQALRLSYELFDGDAQADLIARMERLIAAPDVAQADVVHLGFGLGQHYDRLKQADIAAPYLARANAAYRADLPPMPESDDQKFARIRAAFESGAFDHLRGHGSADARPVFVVGMMRSGTTLVEQIIASHSRAHGAGELMAATNLSAPIWAAGRKATRAQLDAFVTAYLAELTAGTGDALRVVDKMPGNFFNVGLLRIAFPNAAIVNTVRDPRDICLSIWKNFFDTQAHQYAYDQAELARFANDYKRLMDFWDDLFPGEIHHIRYEDLVADQEGQSRKLLDHIGLDWEDGVLDFHKTERAVRTASVNQVRQKIYRSSVAAWEPYRDHLNVLMNGLDMDLWADALAD